MMRVLALLPVLLVAACARGVPPQPAEVTGAVDDGPVEGKIPDGINPLAKEQADAVARMEGRPLTP